MSEEVKKKKQKESPVYMITSVALMAAILCICGPLTVPIGPIPITLFIFALALCSIILGAVKAPLCVLIYLLLGIAGVPVFSGGVVGIAKLLGPSGGYLVGWIFHAFIGGLFAQKFIKKIPLVFVGQILGLIVVYLLGTAWYMYSAKVALAPAMAACVYPFIGIDIGKIVVAMAIGIPVRRQLMKMNLIK